jgi:hypothetical protein
MIREDKDSVYMEIMARKKGPWYMLKLRLKKMLEMWV